MTKDLYTPKDVQQIRELLLKEQNGLDLLTALEIPEKQAVTDHKHDDECFVRGIIHRQVNSYIGKAENNFTRMLAWWYPGSISDFLRQAADYLELPKDERFRHPSWIKHVKTQFNKLNAKQQNLVLEELGPSAGKNPAERKEKFAKVSLDRDIGYAKIKDVINSIKDV